MLSVFISLFTSTACRPSDIGMIYFIFSRNSDNAKFMSIFYVTELCCYLGPSLTKEVDLRTWDLKSIQGGTLWLRFNRYIFFNLWNGFNIFFFDSCWKFNKKYLAMDNIGCWRQTHGYILMYNISLLCFYLTADWTLLFVSSEDPGISSPIWISEYVY